MKKSLIAGVTALVLSFAALTGCATTNSSGNGESSHDTSSEVSTPVVSVAEINQTKTGENNQKVSVKHGLKVRIENVEVFGSYEHKMYVHQAVSIDSSTTLEQVALEVQNENVDFRQYTTSELINLEGVVNAENDHFFLDEAVVTKVVKENPTGEPKNLILYPDFNRGTTLFATRFFNGLGCVTTLQVAEDVGTITTEGKSFKVVFPGEDTDLTNELNTNAMDFVIPSGLDQEEIDFINAYRYGGLTKGQCFETIAALEYVNGAFNFVYIPFIGSNPEYIGGHARSPMTYADFSLVKQNYLPDLVKPEYIDLFPNLATPSAEDPSKSVIYSYLPDDIAFDKENEYQIYFALNTYDVPAAYAQINENLKAQGYQGGKENMDESGMMKTTSWVSDKTSHPLFKVTIQNAADILLEAAINVDLTAVKPYERYITKDTYAELLPELNKSVDNVARRNSVLLPQVEGFETAMGDLTPFFKELVPTTNITLDRINETAYGQNGFLPIIQERIHYNFNWEERPTVEGEGEEMHLVYSDALKTKVRNLTWAVAAYMSSYLYEHGFVYSLNEFLYAEDENGERVPVYVYYNKETSETIQFDVRAPKYNIEDKKFEGDWSIVIFDEIIHAGLAHRITPAEDMEPMYMFPSNVNDYFKEVTKCNSDFVLPEFGAWDMRVGKDTETGTNFRVLMIPNVDDPVTSYTATLEKAGYTVTEKTRKVTDDKGRPVTVKYHEAKNSNTDVVIEFQYDEKSGLFMISAYSTSSKPAL